MLFRSLARSLWIVPLSLVTALALKSKARIQWPWFILIFCLAALLNTVLPAWNHAFSALNQLGKSGLTVTLFLIGTGLNRKTVQRVGFRPLLQGLTAGVARVPQFWCRFRHPVRQRVRRDRQGLLDHCERSHID